MSARALLAAAAALALAGCGQIDREGMILAVDQGYAPEIVLSEKDGIASPDGLLWAEGRLYIADEGGSAIRSWAPGGRVATLASRGDGLQSPEDLARGADGSLWFTDDDAGGLWRVDPAGKAAAVIPAEQGLRSSEGLALSAAGAAVVGDGETGRILGLPAGAAAAGAIARVTKPESMAFDGQGNLYIADNTDDILYVRTADGRLHRPVAGREGFSPETIRFAGGALLITDSHNRKLYRYTPEDGLATIAVFGGKLANLQGVAADEAGNIFVSVQTDLKAGRGYIVRLNRKKPA